MLITICVYALILALCVYAFFKWSFQYWKRRGIPYVEPSIPFGTMTNPIKLEESIADTVLRQYKYCRAQGYRYVGLYGMTNPQFMINDPDIIKYILVKDFNCFMDRGFYCNEEKDPLSAHLFALAGQKWKRLRTKLTPTFTTSKMKTISDFVITCGEQLQVAMSQNCTKGPMEMKHTMELFTTDVIGSCAFGIECNSFSNPNSDFCKYSKRQFVPTTYENFRMFISFMFPGFANFVGMKVVSEEVTDFFMKIIGGAVKLRKEQQITRNDFLQLLMNMMESEDNPKSENTISFNELAAQSFLFFLGGFETSSATLSFTLFELALNPDLQEKAREEVNSVLKKYDGKVTYENVKEMEYLDCVLSEVLRKYPPFPILNRKGSVNYKVPHTDITIEKGMSVVIPVMGLHYDPEYYPNPDKFDPERFNATNKKDRKPFTYLAFGEGNRMCMGARFAVLNAKIGLVYLLKGFEFTMNNKTRLPIKHVPISFALSVEGGIWLDVKEIKKIRVDVLRKERVFR